MAERLNSYKFINWLLICHEDGEKECDIKARQNVHSALKVRACGDLKRSHATRVI